MQPALPRGFRDVLFDEAREREAVTAAISGVFSSWGYEPVETPVVEEYRTLEAGVGPSLEQSAFRLFDLDGSLLALRPELTVPIARVAASRLSEAPGPHRIRYAADVFREHASLRGQARQF
ncbi:MAG: ATP phosphoribosyltransferase regulatory subunit, partial [Coriobacteriia bacterium]|nr:ATP phosphoribosyltransferase regulatory subunit [Coriobacteriia bacterium]